MLRDPNREVFQQMLFSKIVPNCKKLGLLDRNDAWLRRRYEEIGVIQFEDWADTGEEYDGLRARPTRRGRPARPDERRRRQPPAAPAVRSGGRWPPRSRRPSDAFRVLHALRVKGFAKVEVLAELDRAARRRRRAAPDRPASRRAGAVPARPAPCGSCRPAAGPPTPRRLAADVSDRRPAASALEPPYARVPRHQRAVQGAVRRLAAEGRRRPTTTPTPPTTPRSSRAWPSHRQQRPAAVRVLLRRRWTGSRPTASGSATRSGKVQSGDHHLFTGVMCNSYHDVWMELHEDLILDARASTGPRKGRSDAPLRPGRHGHGHAVRRRGRVSTSTRPATLARWLRGQRQRRPRRRRHHRRGPTLTDDEKLACWAAVAEAVDRPGRRRHRHQRHAPTRCT